MAKKQPKKFEKKEEVLEQKGRPLLSIIFWIVIIALIVGLIMYAMGKLPF